ncbi:hypothetical protein [Pseudoxanthobacter sp.]|uniref:hypothetical protein n=1 Tax=Pseudoxanthobacter sp. TaxID=1925742 RepID=UPI002FDF4962
MTTTAPAGTPGRAAASPAASPAAVPDSFRRVRLDLAREPHHPEGSRTHTYSFIAPLDDDGRLSPALWHEHREACRVVRQRHGDQSIGHLVRRPGGSWAFRYPEDAGLGDEAGYRFDAEHFVPGEYISVHESDGMHTFRVIASDPV